jgi:ABC-type sulfate/molybdate transport systems ATPase subunit
MFQHPSLFPHMTVEANIGYGAGPGDEAEKWIAQFQLTDLRSRYPRELSGGEMQRVALARSLAARPRLLLLDEPFANLDPRLRQQMHALVDELRQTHGLTVIVVSHLPHEAARIADRMVFMHEGQITEQGPASITLANPQSPELRDYLQFTPSG